MRGRRRLALIGAMVMALALPGAGANAAKQVNSFAAKLRNPACTDTGGFWGFGIVGADAKIVEKGRNGTNYLVLRASFQRRVNGNWKTLASYGPYTSVSFPNDTENHALIQPFEWAIRAEDVNKVVRWRVKFQWWDKRPGADKLVMEKVRLGETCHT